MSELRMEDLKPGAWYRAKRPRPVNSWHTDREYNDRQIVWIQPSGTPLQYDGPSVKLGQHYPSVSVEKFLAWASHELKEGHPAS